MNNAVKGHKGFKKTTVDEFDYEITRSFLIKIGYDIKSFAQDLGKPYQTITAILKGNRGATPELITQMASVLHLDYNDLLKTK